MLEIVYQDALCWELSKRGLYIEREKIIPVVYKGYELGSSLRLDILVDGKVIVECKSTTNYSTIFEAQTLTYLRITNLKLGIVINFGERLVKNGIHRVANGMGLKI